METDGARYREKLAAQGVAVVQMVCSLVTIETCSVLRPSLKLNARFYVEMSI